MSPRRVRFGKLWVDAVSMDEALAEIVRLAQSGEGGAVFTPNVDHVVKADRDPAFAEAYTKVRLSLADGMPLVWASRLVGLPLPARVAGSDLVPRLLQRAAEQGLRVFFLGGADGSAEEAAKRAAAQGVKVAGVDASRIGITPNPEEPALLARIRESRPHLLLVGLGAPKQELFIARAALPGVVALGVGASIDFLAGRVRRAPRLVGQLGLEWLFRLALEPRRLARRYLIDDPAFAAILARTLRAPREDRVR